ncbi:MAG: antitoxin Xre/MbcA/ParS toxin-binding domain-containing protein [Caldilineaceae bacterium]
MAKSTKKQQQRALKKQKARADKRQLRHADRAPADLGIVPSGVPPSAASTAETALRHSIQAFAFQPRFGADFSRAIALFFEVENVEPMTLTLDEAEMAEFQEWFFMDFVTGSGKRLIELFAEEEGPGLPSDQRQILADWMATNRLRLFEVQAVTPGVGETVIDLLSGEVLHCNDISVSNAARRWSILLARPLLTEGHWHFTGAGKLFSPLKKDRLVRFAQQLWQEYQQKNPLATIDAFYRDCSLQLRRFATDRQEHTQYTVYRTPEHHALVNAMAEYKVRDWRAAARRLDATEEFVFVGDSEEDPDVQHYVWLKRGRSHVPKAELATEAAFELRTEWTLGPGHPSYLTLGDVTVSGTTLELICTSRERLAAGRQLLEAVLEGEITHRGDHFTAMDTTGVASSPAPAAQAPKAADSELRQVQNELLGREMKKWLDTPVPRLNQQTPREAAKTPAGRAALEELLKIMEYLEEGDPGRSETPLSVQAVRRELGLVDPGSV